MGGMTLAVAMVLGAGCADDTVGAGTPGAACSVACDDKEFCYSGECSGIVGRNWTVTVVDVSTGATQPDGSEWDEDDTAPDLKVTVENNGDDLCETAVATDDAAPAFGDVCPVMFRIGGQFWVRVYEVDDGAAEDTLVHEFAWEGSDAIYELARSYPANLAVDDPSGMVSLTLKVVPAF